jgi:protein tyrosine kinase modulator
MNSNYSILADLRYYAGLLKRRFLLVIAPAALVFGAAILAAFVIPPVYKSSATILVESQQIPQDLVRSTVTSSALQRMEVIRQRVLARESVLGVADKLHLYPEESLSTSQIVDRFRKDASIDQILMTDNSRPEAVAFKVSFKYSDAAIAAQVANELVSNILDQDLRTRSGQATETKRFLSNEVERLQHELDAVDAEIAAYKAKHSGFLPENLGYRQSLLLNAQTQKALVDRDIAALEQGKSSSSDATSTEALLDKARLELAQARASFTESHPRVRRLAQQVSELEQAARAAAGTDSEQGPALDPVAKAKAERLRTERADLERRIEELEASITQTSQVEAGLSSLLREQTEAQRAYREASAKLAQAETGERLEEDRQAERLEVIEQPIAARSPSWPNRPIILLLGLFAGAAAGVGPVAAWEILDPSIKRERDLERRLGRRALGLIPTIETDGQRRRKRRNRLLLAIGFLVLVAIAVFGIEYFFTLDAALKLIVDALKTQH